MSVCLRCGSELESTYKFCMSCGYPIQGNNITEQNSYAQNSTQTTNNQVCKKCGGRIEETDLFCLLCGYPTPKKTQAEANRSSRPANEKEKCIDELSRMYDYFKSANSQYSEYDVCYFTRERLNQKLKEDRQSRGNGSLGYLCREKETLY